MRFTETPIAGAWIIDLEFHEDERGGFARTYCPREFAEHGIELPIAQCNMAYNHVAGTMRGLHYQVPPVVESKLVRCTAGAIHDVIVDMRPDSETYLRSFGIELSAANRRSIFIPNMMAHGYLTLADDTEVQYQVSEFYTPGHERGVAYDDPGLGIDWPRDVAVISAKDTTWAPLNAVADPAVVDPAVVDPAGMDPAVMDPAVMDPAVMDEVGTVAGSDSTIDGAGPE